MEAPDDRHIELDFLSVEYTSGGIIDRSSHKDELHFITHIGGRLLSWDISDQEVELGRITGWKIDVEGIFNGENVDLWDVLDAESGYLEHMYSALFESGALLKQHVADTLSDQIGGDYLDSPTSIVALHSVEIEAPYAGKDLEAELVVRTIDVFESPLCLVTLLPYPVENVEDIDSARLSRRRREASLYWQQFGFLPVRGSKWLISMSHRVEMPFAKESEGDQEL